MKKKVLAMLLASCMMLGLAACGGGDKTAATSGTDDAAATTDDAAPAETETEDTAGDEAAAPALDGEVSVFYYTYGDTYISSVRSALDAALESKGIAYQDYDSNNSQTTQTR